MCSMNLSFVVQTTAGRVSANSQIASTVPDNYQEVHCQLHVYQPAQCQLTLSAGTTPVTISAGTTPVTISAGTVSANFNP